ncbi:hypothetical protein R3P38DRAFT_3180008 [Favolaschia claudopus]|uniref:Uncharacterized protein n=1 Tax=Favolaschia claudopus TaxID=2862362 RepID=A0AAW0CS82_9AGAR
MSGKRLSAAKRAQLANARKNIPFHESQTPNSPAPLHADKRNWTHTAQLEDIVVSGELSSGMDVDQSIASSGAGPTGDVEMVDREGDDSSDSEEEDEELYH